MSECKFCQNGWFDVQPHTDLECVNGVLIDIDVATEGWERNTCYPPAPCQACSRCKGKGCTICRESGWKSGRDESQKRLKQWASASINNPTPSLAATDPAALLAECVEILRKLFDIYNENYEQVIEGAHAFLSRLEAGEAK